MNLFNVQLKDKQVFCIKPHAITPYLSQSDILDDSKASQTLDDFDEQTLWVYVKNKASLGFVKNILGHYCMFLGVYHDSLEHPNYDIKEMGGKS